MSINFKKEIIIFSAIFALSCVFVYLLLNGGAYFAILRYNLILKSPFAEAGLKNPILDFKNLWGSETAWGGENYTLYIPKINVVAPVIFPKDKTNGSILAALEEGTVIYPDSQLPGKKGRAVILGHSSSINWYRGKYSYVFALLSKLEEGDEFFIVSGNKKLTYRVFANDILTASQTNNILSEPAGDASYVNLVTCWPVGSDSKRTLIQAKLVKE